MWLYENQLLDNMFDIITDDDTPFPIPLQIQKWELNLWRVQMHRNQIWPVLRLPSSSLSFLAIRFQTLPQNPDHFQLSYIFLSCRQSVSPFRECDTDRLLHKSMVHLPMCRQDNLHLFMYGLVIVLLSYNLQKLKWIYGHALSWCLKKP